MKWFALFLMVCMIATGAVFPTGAATVEQPIAGIVHYDIYTNVDVADIYFNGAYIGRTSGGYLQGMSHPHHTPRRWHPRQDINNVKAGITPVTSNLMR